MAALPRESLQVEPAVKVSAANKDLRQKNIRASYYWGRAKNALEREKRQWRKGNLDDRNKLLKQREELRSTSLSLTAKLNQSVDAAETNGAVSAPQVRRQVSLKDVYNALMEAQRKEAESQEDNRSVKSIKSESTLATSHTVSSERKRTARKSLSFSLQGLQRAQSNLQSKLQALEKAHQDFTGEKEEGLETRGHSVPPTSHFDLTDEERSLGPTLKLPPTRLPSIDQGVNFKPRIRTFEKDEEFIAKQHGKEYNFDDIPYCRYLRRATRTRSSTS